MTRLEKFSVAFKFPGWSQFGPVVPVLAFTLKGVLAWTISCVVALPAPPGAGCHVVSRAILGPNINIPMSTMFTSVEKVGQVSYQLGGIGAL